MEHVQTSFIPVLIIHIYSCTRSLRTLSLHRCRLRHRKYRYDLRDISHFHWNGSVLPHTQRRFPWKHLLMRYRLHRLFRGLWNFRNRCSVLRLLRVPPPECRLCSNSRLHYCRLQLFTEQSKYAILFSPFPSNLSDNCETPHNLL